MSSGLVDYPKELAEQYRRRGYWRDGTIADAIAQVVQQHGHRTALVTGEGQLTYADLGRRTDCLAAGLLDLGLRPGDAVTLQLANTQSTVLSWYALLKAGLLPVCTLSRHRHHEIDQIARATSARAHLVQHDLRGVDAATFAREVAQTVDSVEHLLVTQAEEPVDGLVRIDDIEARIGPADARDAVRDVQRAIAPDDVAVLQLSGGTTARPKIIPRRHAEYLYNVRARTERWSITDDDTIGYVLPLVHNAGVQAALHLAHLAGIPLVLGEPDPDDFLDLFATNGVTRTLLPSGLAATLMEHPAFPRMVRSLRVLALTLGRVPGSLFDRVTELGTTVIQEFGMGEGLIMTHALDDPELARRTTVGTPLSPADEVRLLDDSGDPVPDGHPGELHVRGPYTIRGYLGEPERNAQVFSPDGFYATGDVMAAHVIEGQTFYSVEDRTKDLINRGGEKINSAEVEMLLLEHPAIRDAAVVAMPDERLGERTCAFVVTDDPLTLVDVQQHFARLDVAKFKWPEHLERVPELPRTAVGKLAKQKLRDEIATRLHTNAEPAGA